MAFIPQVFNVPSFVTGTSLTPALQVPGNYLYMYLVVPTMSAGYSTASTPIWIQCSTDGVTYYRFSNPENNTNTVGTNDFQIVSSTSQRVINLPVFSFQFVKFEISGTCTTPASASPFKLICVSNQ